MKTTLLRLLLMGCLVVSSWAQSSDGQTPITQRSKDSAQQKNDAPPSRIPIYAPNSNSETTKNQSQSEPESPPYTQAEKLTVVLIVVAVAQAVIYYLQWWWMRKTLIHATLSSERQTRAYLVIVHGQEEKDDANTKFTVRVKNCGQTPAKNVKMHFGWKAVGNTFQEPWPTGAAYEIITGENGSKFTLGAGVDLPCTVMLGGIENCMAEIFASNECRRTVFYFGTIFYTDVFGREWTTDYCIRHVPGKFPSQGFICDHHNEST